MSGLSSCCVDSVTPILDRCLYNSATPFYIQINGGNYTVSVKLFQEVLNISVQFGFSLALPTSICLSMCVLQFRFDLNFNDK